MGEILKEKIESTRAKMIDVANRNGLQAEETTNISQKLDILMNQYELCLKRNGSNDAN